MTLPAPSLAVAPNAYVLPTATLPDAGLTVSDAIVGLGALGTTLPVATVRLSTHIVWSTGEPSPMYGAIMNWLNFIVGCAPVRSNAFVRSITTCPSNQYRTIPSVTPLAFWIVLSWRYASTRCQSPLYPVPGLGRNAGCDAFHTFSFTYALPER